MIYFLGEPLTTNVKIGFTQDEETLLKRIKKHQCGNSSNLTVIGLIEGDRHTESRIHKNFKNLHIRGEWFHYTGNLKRYVERQTASIPDAMAISHQ